MRETEEGVARKNQQLSTLSAELAKARETLEEEEKEEGEYVYMCMQSQSVTCTCTCNTTCITLTCGVSPVTALC